MELGLSKSVPPSFSPEHQPENRKPEEEQIKGKRRPVESDPLTKWHREESNTEGQTPSEVHEDGALRRLGFVAVGHVRVQAGRRDLETECTLGAPLA